MSKPVTIVCMLLAAGSGLYLYQTKHRAHLLDRDIARTMAAVDAAHARAGVLRAEYALLNDPSRLADLAGHYLPALHTTEPRQFTSIGDLDKRLPAVAPPPPDPVEPPPPEPQPAPDPVLAAVATQATPAPSPATTVSQMRAVIAAVTQPIGTANAASASRAPVTVTPLASAQATQVPAAEPRPAPPPARHPVIQAAIARPAPAVATVAPPVAATITPVVATASPPPFPSPQPFTGSALGMARLMAHPQLPVRSGPGEGGNR